MSDATPPPPPDGSQPGYGYGGSPTGVGQPADLLMRFLARLIDFILVAVVGAIVGGLVGALAGGGSSVYGFGATTNYTAGAAIGSLVSAVISLAYFVLMESRTGQTVGKMLLKLRTEAPDGSTPTLEQAVRRNFWVGLSILGVIPFLGVLASLAQLVIMIVIAVTISSSSTRQGWHDGIAGGTKVMKIG